LIRTAYQTGKAEYGAGSTRRELILHDSLAFFTLAVTTLALYGVTFFLFRSFESHREELAASWTQRGQAELQQGKPADAVNSLRASLSYMPDNYPSQLLLAQALAAAGETDQATNYFLNLWTARPGDGFLNLELARVTRQKAESQHAIDYYRSAILGDWQGDAVIRRRQVRLELIDYLIQLRRLPAARAELLIAAGNAPDDRQLDILFGDKLLAAADPQDALTFYQRSIADDPHNAVALEKAGRLKYAEGDYKQAQELLTRAIENTPHAIEAPADLTALARNAARLVELSLSPDLPARERARHLLEAAQIAQTRFDNCTGNAATLPSELQSLQTRWKAATDPAHRNALVQNAAGQDSLTQLIFDTERETETTCGPATGDDELLLKLSESTSSGGNP
jgi:tetratricopeptide (TPR) repeat protein